MRGGGGAAGVVVTELDSGVAIEPAVVFTSRRQEADPLRTYHP
jgi:hypothetical protein